VPDFAKEAKEDGWVVIHFTVSEEGEVIDPELQESSDRIFNESAMSAIRRWRFKPYTIDDRPIPIRSRVKFEFKS
jgi:protein TonB